MAEKLITVSLTERELRELQVSSVSMMGRVLREPYAHERDKNLWTGLVHKLSRALPRPN